MNRYYIETEARISTAFTDVAGAPVDPDTVILRLKAPKQSEVNVTPVRDGVGLYHYDVDLNVGGIWTYQWQGEGAVTAASPFGLMQVL
jgi:hypothetical protein